MHCWSSIRVWLDSRFPRFFFFFLPLREHLSHCSEEGYSCGSSSLIPQLPECWLCLHVYLTLNTRTGMRSHQDPVTLNWLMDWFFFNHLENNHCTFLGLSTLSIHQGYQTKWCLKSFRASGYSSHVYAAGTWLSWDPIRMYLSATWYFVWMYVLIL